MKTLKAYATWALFNGLLLLFLYLGPIKKIYWAQNLFHLLVLFQVLYAIASFINYLSICADGKNPRTEREKTNGGVNDAWTIPVGIAVDVVIVIALFACGWLGIGAIYLFFSYMGYGVVQATLKYDSSEKDAAREEREEQRKKEAEKFQSDFARDLEELRNKDKEKEL